MYISSSTRQKGNSENCKLRFLLKIVFLQLIFFYKYRAIIFGMNHALHCYFILKIQRSIYDLGSKEMGPSSEFGPFAKTFNEHCLESLAHMS